MMNLVKWNPWREMDTFQNRISRLFDDPMFRTVRFDDAESLGLWYPTVDMYEKDDNFVIKAELPGLDKNDISIEVKDRLLTVKGERKYDNEVKEDNYYRKERSYGRFQRSFTLPEEVDAEKVKAEFKDGILNIVIPRPEDRKSKQITVH